MHVIEGTTLGETLEPARHVRRPSGRGRGELADALAYAHAAGVVHRDVKPGNVLVQRHGQVRLTDFGIARLIDDSTRHTATGMTVGTAAYLSPEQLTGREVGPATDVYSLGLVLIEALSGRQVYDGPVTETGPARVASAPAIPSGVPDEWRALLGEMTAVDPADRPSAEQVRRRLAELSDVPAAAPTSIAPDPTRLLTRLTTTVSEARTTVARTPGRSKLPVPYLLLALAAVGVVAVVVLISAVGGSEAPPRTEVPASVPADLKPGLRTCTTPSRESSRERARPGRSRGDLPGAAGCGGDTAPVDDEPELAEALQQVDDSLAAEDYATAESALARAGRRGRAGRGRGDAEQRRERRHRQRRAGTGLAAAGRQAEPPPPAEPEPTVAPEPEDEPAPEDDGEDEESKPPKEPKEPKEPRPGAQGAKGPKGKERRRGRTSWLEALPR